MSNTLWPKQETREKECGRWGTSLTNKRGQRWRERETHANESQQKHNQITQRQCPRPQTSVRAECRGVHYKRQIKRHSSPSFNSGQKTNLFPDKFGWLISRLIPCPTITMIGAESWSGERFGLPVSSSRSIILLPRLYSLTPEGRPTAVALHPGIDTFHG